MAPGTDGLSGPFRLWSTLEICGPGLRPPQVHVRHLNEANPQELILDNLNSCKKRSHKTAKPQVVGIIGTRDELFPAVCSRWIRRLITETGREILAPNITRGRGQSIASRSCPVILFPGATVNAEGFL
jgi:hypothetical protein